MEKFSARNALYDLFSIAPQLKNVRNNRPEFDALIGFILSKDFYKDEEIPYPTLKEVEEELGLKTHTLRKLIKDLYNDILNQEKPFLKFKKTEIVFYLSYLDRRFQFSLLSLPVIPRVGESFEISFVNAKMDARRFYVDQVYHELELETQKIFILLKDGHFNTYLKFRRDKADSLKELHFKERHIDDWTFTQKLRKGELEP